VSRWQFLTEPLAGRTSIGKVVWVYGLLGSLLYGLLGLLIGEDDLLIAHLYTLGGFVFSVYVTVATYQCARNCKTGFGRRFVRVCAVLTLVLLPFFTYLEWSGALDLTSLRGLE
jgi:hypothetical protein